ncbi:response regulator [Rhodospirillum centenum]|uniref:Chemotaxis protein CheY, putative n=1 Tax=Rhodospirillum centenum (strain ATCC 51521 / SW) TaxID=414684 RepID=B6IQR1_RHOCS|nr:response regulator [Rhodospirillum centenum]ACI97797.1 chemotaxis protein CheY, putative [Rhodospirillum centenum SW]
MSLIFVIDDSPTMVMSLSRILAKYGYSVETATNGQDGLKRLKGGMKPNLILTDINMPEMDGITFIKEARKHAPTRFTPIVVLTTESVATKQSEARSAGASGWLTKPTQPDDLIATIRQLLPA